MFHDAKQGGEMQDLLLPRPVLDRQRDCDAPMDHFRGRRVQILPRCL